MVKDIVYAAAIVIIGGWSAYKEFHQKQKQAEYKLADNPERCNQHEIALATIGTRLDRVEKDISEIKDTLNGKNYR